MNSGRDENASTEELMMTPPAAPLAMPVQTIERKRRTFGFFNLFAIRFFAAR